MPLKIFAPNRSRTIKELARRPFLSLDGYPISHKELIS
jgi:hypothetical protein